MLKTTVRKAITALLWTGALLLRLANALSALYPKDYGEKRVLGDQRGHHYMLNVMSGAGEK